MSEAALRVNLQAGYGKTTVLEQVGFELRAGERLGLLGPSGSGKSTLLLALLNLLPHRGGWVRGEVSLQGRNLLELPARAARAVRGRDLALVPQSPLSALNPAVSLQTHFEQCWNAHRPADPQPRAARVRELLARVALPSDAAFLKRKPGEISVGQAQRCTLALALLHRPPVVIADEPTSSLDPVSQTEVLHLFREMCEQEGAALLFVSHDLLSVLRLCTTVSVLSGGRLAETLPAQEIVLAKDSTLRQLVRALPVPAEVLIEHTAAGTRERMAPGDAAVPIPAESSEKPGLMASH